MMKMTHWIIRAAPIGIFAIVAQVVYERVGSFRDPGSLGRFLELVGTMGSYMLTVASGLFLHAVVTLPLVLYFLARVNPRRQAGAMSSALLTAFSTASSSATLPLTMESVEKRAGVSNRVTSFVLPLGATVNMDGTALYECVAAIFIAQAYGIHLTFLQQIVVVFTALLASIGAAGVPMAGLVTITIILHAVGLPMEGVGLILSVDRILDMMRTVVNVWSDSCGAVTLARLEGETGLKVGRGRGDS
jgi:Na+/H+-dicarboxylate symporter